MSNVSQGPGWWIASDQKWYPPESHPGYQPPPPGPSAYPSYSSYSSGQATYPNLNSPSSTGPLLASYGQRLGGWLIDWVILLVVASLISAVTHSIHYTHISTTANGTHWNFRWGMPGALLGPLIIVVYGTLMCGNKRAQTLGMMVAGTKAVKASTGAPIGYPAALGRALFEWLMAAIFFFPWVLDMLFPLWDAKKQTLHDKVSGTIVVRADRS
jgi:uncharacterized RDD family membrane protein YckC